MLTILKHSEVAYRDCADCQKWLYEESGARAVYPGTNEPIPRPTGVSTPCRIKGKGCPKGTPEALLTLNPQNWKVYEHYQRCAAVGRFPDDPIVERHAGIIRGLEEAAARARQDGLMQAIVRAIGG